MKTGTLGAWQQSELSSVQEENYITVQINLQMVTMRTKYRHGCDFPSKEAQCLNNQETHSGGGILGKGCVTLGEGQPELGLQGWHKPWSLQYGEMKWCLPFIHLFMLAISFL